jgi:DNA-binding beta-propeller fold protein YncE
MKRVLAFCLSVCATLAAQRMPPPTDLAGRPFFIKKTWVIGGVGNWDYLTLDPVARQLFIAHGPAVQVVDVATGLLAGTVTGLREAHSIALDPDGAFGYITDGPASQVKVFDRRSLQVVAAIPTGPAPRAMAFEPQTKWLFVIGAQPIGEKPAEAEDGNSSARRESSRNAAPKSQSTVTVIDTETRKQLVQIVVSGALGFVEADGNGQVFVTVSDLNQIARLDAVAIGSALNRLLDTSPASQPSGPATKIPKAVVLDWTSDARPAPPPEVRPHFFALGLGCQEPRALAIDAPHQRLFAACTNMKMAVLDEGNGEPIASVPIGLGADAIGFDADRGLIFSANGGGDGSVTIIRQDVTDTYSVVQILPTRQRARTLAINSSTGEVYLASVMYGAALDRPPMNGLGTLKMNPVDGSFQVLVIGN